MKIYRIAKDPLEMTEMTEDEFVDYHRTGYIAPDSYDSYKTPKGMDWIKKEKHPVLHSIKQFGDKTIEFRQSGEKLKYTQYDPNAEWEYEHLRDSNGELIYMTDEQMIEKGYPLYDTSIAAFDGDVAIGFVSNEFGTDGVWVVDDYQGLGIGTYLLSEHRKYFSSDRKIGQMTPAGEKMTRSYYRQMKNQQ